MAMDVRRIGNHGDEDAEDLGVFSAGVSECVVKEDWRRGRKEGLRDLNRCSCMV